MLCANSKTNNCTEIVNNKGNIYCESCQEIKKNNIKSKRESDFQELLNKISELESENMKLRQAIFENKSSFDKEIKNIYDENEKKNLENIEKNFILIKEKDNLEQTIINLNQNIEKLELEKINKIKFEQSTEKQIREFFQQLTKIQNELMIVSKERDEIKFLYEQIKIDYDKICIERKNKPKFISDLDDRSYLNEEEPLLSPRSISCSSFNSQAFSKILSPKSARSSFSPTSKIPRLRF